MFLSLIHAKKSRNVVLFEVSKAAQARGKAHKLDKNQDRDLPEVSKAPQARGLHEQHFTKITKHA